MNLSYIVTARKKNTNPANEFLLLLQREKEKVQIQLISFSYIVTAREKKYINPANEFLLYSYNEKETKKYKSS